MGEPLEVVGVSYDIAGIDEQDGARTVEDGAANIAVMAGDFQALHARVAVQALDVRQRAEGQRRRRQDAAKGIARHRDVRLDTRLQCGKPRHGHGRQRLARTQKR